MSITPTPKIAAAVFSEIHSENSKRADRRLTQEADASKRTAGTQVKLSNQIQWLQADSADDINTEQLDKIKAALAAGELPINTDKIAASLVQEMFQGG